MEIGIDTFVDTGMAPSEAEVRGDATRVAHMLEEAELADRVGLDVYAVGEHHRPDFLASAPAILLAAIAARTSRIRLASAVTVLSSDDPVRVFQQFATLDLISNGRAEIIVGRGSFIESYPLFGFDLDNYDALFSEKLDLLLKLREKTTISWAGKHRASLSGQGVYPRPVQNPLPVKIGVGGTPQSFVRAGLLGLPLVVAIIGGEPHRFRPLIDLYRDAGRRAGKAPEALSVAVHVHGHVGETDQAAHASFFPVYQAGFNRIGRERGWPPVTPSQYDAQVSPLGALAAGSPETVAAKIVRMYEALGGIDRVTMIQGSGGLPHEAALASIERLGSQVKPLVAAGIKAKLN
ncbi:MAG: LLM class flavin-dependent oxidoreductase [Ancalomicrobiaceae bacterium]|nr:LLM class flavin-dependent oxidoreductase [Ancalomicrobiaceae bacterium]